MKHQVQHFPRLTLVLLASDALQMTILCYDLLLFVKGQAQIDQIDATLCPVKQMEILLQHDYYQLNYVVVHFDERMTIAVSKESLVRFTGIEWLVCAAHVLLHNGHQR